MAASYIPFEFTSGTYRAKLRASYEDAFGSGSYKDSDAYLFSESKTFGSFYYASHDREATSSTYSMVHYAENVHRTIKTIMCAKYYLRTTAVGYTETGPNRQTIFSVTGFTSSYTIRASTSWETGIGSSLSTNSSESYREDSASGTYSYAAPIVPQTATVESSATGSVSYSGTDKQNRSAVYTTEYLSEATSYTASQTSYNRFCTAYTFASSTGSTIHTTTPAASSTRSYIVEKGYTERETDSSAIIF
jgi:hypothetical protein